MFINMSKGNFLNFRVEAYDSEENLVEAKPANGTVGVVTDSFESYVVSGTEPEEPADGLLWIQTSIDSPIKIVATKKNPITLHPILVWQYKVRGWVAITSYFFTDNVWRPLGRRYLLNNGDFCEFATGGWEGKPYPYNPSTGYPMLYAVNENDRTRIACVKSNWGEQAKNGGTVATYFRIDLTPYKTLVFEGQFVRDADYASSAHVQYSCWPEFDLEGGYRDSVAACVEFTTDNSEAVVIDVSALEGEHYVGVGVRAANVYITACYLDM